MGASQRVKLHRTGRRQTVRIPEGFELPGREALLRREGSYLVLEPVGKPSLLEVLDGMDAVADAFPDVDVGLPTLRDVEI